VRAALESARKQLLAGRDGEACFAPSRALFHSALKVYINNQLKKKWEDDAGKIAFSDKINYGAMDGTTQTPKYGTDSGATGDGATDSVALGTSDANPKPHYFMEFVERSRLLSDLFQKHLEQVKKKTRRRQLKRTKRGKLPLLLRVEGIIELAVDVCVPEKRIFEFIESLPIGQAPKDVAHEVHRLHVEFDRMLGCQEISGTDRETFRKKILRASKELPDLGMILKKHHETTDPD